MKDMIEECGRQYDDRNVMPTFTLSFVFVTPELAKKWLEKNGVNRAISRSNVEKYKKALSKKRFGTTHHGIAFNANGVLIDGQHRLIAIAESGIGVWLVVARDMDIERAIDLPVDIGSIRSRHCMLEKRQQTVLLASFIEKTFGPHSGDIYEIKAIHDAIEPFANALLDSCGTNSATKSAAASRAAVLLRTMIHPESAEEIRTQFRRYVLLEDPGLIWQSVLALARKVDRREIISTRQLELFSKTFCSFDPSRRDVNRLSSRDQAEVIEEARILFGDIMKRFDKFNKQRGIA